MQSHKGAFKPQQNSKQGDTALWQKYQEFRSENEEYLKGAIKDGQYYLGNHYSKKELRKLKKRGQAPSMVNYAYSMVYTQMSIMLANSPTFRSIARDDNDYKKTKLINDVLAFIHYISDGDMEVRDAVENMLIFGRGQLEYYWDPESDDGMGDVKFESVPIDEVFWDPKARKRYGQDSQAIFRTKTMLTKTALQYYPQYANLIRGARSALMSNSGFMNPNPSLHGTMWGTDNMTGGANRQDINVTTAYVKNMERLHNIVSQGQIVAKDVPQQKVMQVYHQLASQGMKIDNVITRKNTYINKNLMFGPYVAFTEKMPVSDYPIVPFCNMWTGNMFPFGDIRQIRPLIDEANKIRSLRIHNMATASNGKMLARKGLFDNEKQAEQNMARPGSISFVNTVGDDIRKDIMPVNTSAIHPESFQHEAMTQQNIQQVSGVYEMQQGGTAQAPDTFRATLAFDEFGQRKLKYKLKNVELALGHGGGVALELAQHKFPLAKTVRVVEPEWNSREEEVRYKKLNVPTFDTYGNIVKKFNDISVGKYDVIVKGGSTMPSNRWAEQQAYKEDLQLGIIDDIEYLKKTDIYDRQGLIERKSIYSQQKQQIDQLSQAIEKLQKDNDKLHKETMDSKKKLELQKAQAEYKLAMTEAKHENEWDKKTNKFNMHVDRESAQLDYEKKEQSMEHDLDEAIHKYKMATNELKAKAKIANKPKGQNN